MGYKKKSLISGIIATALVIGLLESEVIQLSGPFLYGDENNIPLIRKKGDDTFVVQPGEQVIINNNVYTYKSVDVASRHLSWKMYLFLWVTLAPSIMSPGRK